MSLPKIKLTHDNVSFVKSLLRIGAAISLLVVGLEYGLGWFVAAGAFLGLAEILGIVEEIV